MNLGRRKVGPLRLALWSLALAAVASCTAAPPREPFQPAPATGGVSGSGGQAFMPLPIEDIPEGGEPGFEFPTCEEQAVGWADGCAGLNVRIECVHVPALQPVAECDGEPFGFGGASPEDEGGAGEGGVAGHGGEQGQAVHGSRCPPYDPTSCQVTICVDQARVLPDGSAECCYGLWQLTCH